MIVRRISGGRVKRGLICVRVKDMIERYRVWDF